jgi:FAD/FMN-containing dehydrogenase
MTSVTNFGGNVQFAPAKYLEPEGEAELLQILSENRTGNIRVVASRHAWSDLIVTSQTLINMRNFNSVTVFEENGEKFATVGGGCQMKNLLAALSKQGLTTPSIGLITEQTIAGATATGTHGSGKHSLSHYIVAARIGCFAGENGSPVLVDVTAGEELEAARCSLGCLGVVVSVTIPVVPQYRVSEVGQFCDTVDDALAMESESPIQQFFLLPHRWKYVVQRRAITEEPISRTAWLYRIYWFLSLDIGLHLGVKILANWLRSRILLKLLFNVLLPLMVFKWRIVDQSERVLVMEHELFQHLELEAFVPSRCVADAARFTELVLRQSGGENVQVPEALQEQLTEKGLWEEFVDLKGCFLPHFPVCFRKILQDKTLISMASGSDEAWYSISLITYAKSREPFFKMATFLSRSMQPLFQGRIHWGKWFPLVAADVEQMYPKLNRFREICQQFDPSGVFQNDFTREVLGMTSKSHESGN